ncbi:MAG: choice-of-anchor Q domain-containing protein [Paludibacter sp.]|nr:choice-of-anchor Q domain-containing protein [Paludibacter sp.]
MKKITLLLALVCSMSLFATRYLVQTGAGGAATWRAAEAGETLVDLTVAGQSFNTWYTATVVANDEVWMAAGTYVLSGVVTIALDNHSVYGGFAGTETATSQRAKVVDGYPWEFTNATVLDGNNAMQVLLAANVFPNVLFDGLTLTKGSASVGAVQYRDGVTLRNCKIINNNSTGNGGGLNLYQGGQIIDSYIAGNVASTGGGIYSNNATTAIAVVSGCLIENNRAYTTAGGIRVQGAGPGTTDVIDCIIRGNKGLDNAGTVAKPGGAIYTNSIYNKFNNCLVYNNQGTNAVYFNGGNFNNVTVVNNIGQVYIANASVAIGITNSIVWGNKTDVTGATNTGITSNTTNTNVNISNSAVYPGLALEAYTQTDNIAIEINNDSQEGAKGPGFLTPTTFWGAPVGETQTTEFLAADWKIKYTSGCLGLGKTLAGITTDLIGISRPQGAAYDIGAYELSYFNTIVTFNAGGTVNALTSGDILSEPEGKPMAFTITPNSGKEIASVKYNNVEVKGDMVGNVYTAPALAADATLVVEFSIVDSFNQINKTFACFSTKNSIELRGVNAGQEVTVYSLTGVRMFNVKAVHAEMSIAVARGIYVVKVADMVKKVVVD